MPAVAAPRRGGVIHDDPGDVDPLGQRQEQRGLAGRAGLGGRPGLDRGGRLRSISRRGQVVTGVGRRRHEVPDPACRPATQGDRQLVNPVEQLAAIDDSRLPRRRHRPSVRPVPDAFLPGAIPGPDRGRDHRLLARRLELHDRLPADRVLEEGRPRPADPAGHVRARLQLGGHVGHAVPPVGRGVPRSAVDHAGGGQVRAGPLGRPRCVEVDAHEVPAQSPAEDAEVVAGPVVAGFLARSRPAPPARPLRARAQPDDRAAGRAQGRGRLDER